MEILENDEPDISSRWSGLKQRVLSAALLVVIALVALWQGGFLFTLLVALASLVMIKEWNTITEDEGPAFRLAGYFYVAVPCAALIWLRYVRVENVEFAGMKLILFVMLCVWATDIGAYFTGRAVGGPKLAPSISPNKTWAGLGGGISASFVTAGLCHIFSPYPLTIWGSLLFGIVIAVVAQAGDLFESWLKRRANVKDSGTLIPGHGGLLDRIDGLIFTIPLFALMVHCAGLAL